MAMIKINGVDMPTPSDFSVGIQDISKAERNANGTLIKEIIATKRKLELSYKYLTNENLSTLLTALSANSFTVTYPDPQNNSNTTKTFYCGDRTCGAIDYVSNTIRWKDVKFSLVEY